MQSATRAIKPTALLATVASEWAAQGGHVQQDVNEFLIAYAEFTSLVPPALTLRRSQLPAPPTGLAETAVCVHPGHYRHLRNLPPQERGHAGGRSGSEFGYLLSTPSATADHPPGVPESGRPGAQRSADRLRESVRPPWPSLPSLRQGMLGLQGASACHKGLSHARAGDTVLDAPGSFGDRSRARSTVIRGPAAKSLDAGELQRDSRADSDRSAG